MVIVSLLRVTPSHMPTPTNTKQENCLLDCRVSDPLQLKGGSLELQEMLGRKLAEKQGWKVIKVYRQPHSATTTERDDIEEIEEFIKSTEIKVHHIIFKCIDRFTREGSSEYERRKVRLEKLGVQVWDTQGIIQPKKNTLEHLGDFKYKWSYYSPSEGAEMLAAHQGKQEWRDIINRLIGAEIQLVRAGYSVRRAPDGLKNKIVLVGSKEYTSREANIARSHFFVEMMELRARGMDDKDIVERINAMGFRTQTYRHWDRTDKEHPVVIGKHGGKLLTVKQLQRFVQCTEYAGVTCEKWTHYKPVRMQEFRGIVSIETFNLANRGKVYIKENPDGSLEILRDYEKYLNEKPKRLKNNPDYRYKFFPCPICSKSMLGSSSKGKSGAHYSAYHCGGATSGARAHKYVRFPKEEYENSIQKFIVALKFTGVMVDSFGKVLNDVYLTREKEVVAQSSMISHNVGGLKAQQASALDTLTVTQSAVTRKKLEEKIDDLERQIQEAEGQRDEIEVNEKDIKAFVKYVKTIMEHPSEILMDTDSMHAQQILFGLVFDELPTYPEILNGTPKLSLAFKLSEDYINPNSQCVTPRGVEPRFKA